MDRKQKYVKLSQYNGIVIFPCFVEHSKFQNLGILTAGFCYVDARWIEFIVLEILFFGVKIRWNRDSKTKQVF